MSVGLRLERTAAQTGQPRSGSGARPPFREYLGRPWAYEYHRCSGTHEVITGRCKNPKIQIKALDDMMVNEIGGAFSNGYVTDKRVVEKAVGILATLAINNPAEAAEAAKKIRGGRSLRNGDGGRLFTLTAEQTKTLGEIMAADRVKPEGNAEA